MSSIIGLENLPNVYISKIELYDVTGGITDDFHAMIEVCIKDVKDSTGKFSWYHDSLLTNNLSIMVVMSNTKAITDKLTSGELMMDPQKIIRDPDYTPGSIEFKSLPIKMKKFTEPDERTGMYSMMFRYRFKIKSSYERAVVFAASYVDFSKLSSQFGGEVSPYFSSFYGPIVSDEVFGAGSPPTQSSVYTLPNGTIYTGPIHMHDGTIMGGSRHSSMPHPILTEKTVKNNKIRDYRRVATALARKQSVEDVEKLYFSELMSTYDQGNKIRLFFSMNMETIFLTKTKYGKFIKKFSGDDYTKILNRFQFKSFTVKREKIMPAGGLGSGNTRKITKRRTIKTDEIVSTKDFNQGGLIGTTKLRPNYIQTPNEYIQLELDRIYVNKKLPDGTNTLQEKPLQQYKLFANITEPPYFFSPAKEVRSFIINDYSANTSNDSFYRYMVDATIVDPSIKYVYDVITAIRREISSLSEFISAATSRKNYDYEMGKLKNSFFETYGGNYWQKTTDLYIKYLSGISKLDDLAMVDIGAKMSSYIATESLNVRSCKIYIKKYRELLKNVISFFGIKNSTIKHNISVKGQKVFQRKQSPYVRVFHVFDDVVNFQNTDINYDYHGLDDGYVSALNFTGLLSYTPEMYEERLSDEIKKYDGGQINFDVDSLKSLSEQDQKEMLNVVGKRRTYMSPKIIKSPSIKIDCSQKKKLNIKKLNMLRVQIPHLKPKVNKKNNFMKKAKRTTRSPIGSNNVPFSIRRPSVKKFTIKQVNRPRVKEKDIDFVDSTDYLGANSPFNSDPVVVEKLKPLEIKEKLKTDKRVMNIAFLKLRKKSFRRSAARFNLKSPNNIFQKRSPRNRIPRQLSRVPMQIKSLMASDQIVKEEIDILELPETSTAMDLNHFALQKVSILAGYEKWRGTYQLKKPIFIDLDEENYDRMSGQFILCRMKQYSDPANDIVLDEEMQLNVYNDLFEIQKRSETSDEVGNPNSASDYGVLDVLLTNNFPEYSTTNLVMQSQQRDAINRSYSYSVAPVESPTLQAQQGVPMPVNQGRVAAIARGEPDPYATVPSTQRNEGRSSLATPSMEATAMDSPRTSDAVPSGGGGMSGGGGYSGGGGGMSGGGSSGGY